MEDSFEARLNGDYKPPRAEKKGGKGWMVTSIVLFVFLLGAGAFAVAMVFSNNSNGDKMLNAEAQISEKDAKIAELETTIVSKDNQIAALKSSTSDDDDDEKEEVKDLKAEIAALREDAKKSGDTIQDNVIKIFANDDSKYYVAEASIDNAMGIFYREKEAGSSWKLLRGLQAAMSCDNLSAKDKEVLKGVENCYEGGEEDSNLVLIK